MKIKHKRIFGIQICGVLLLSVLINGCVHHRSGKSHNVSIEIKDDRDPECLFYKQTDTTQNAWNDTTEFFHYWKAMDSCEYLLSKASSDSVELWKRRCEELNNPDNVGIGQIPSRYANINQYVTIHDLLSIWMSRSYDGSYDDFTLWRLEQFRSDTLHPVSGYEKYLLLTSTIDGLCDFEPYFKFEYDNWSCLEEELQEFQARLLLHELLPNYDVQIRKALLKEESAWESYHAALDTTYRIISGDPNHFNGSGWGQAIMGIMQDDALIRECSLLDICFSSDEHYVPTTHKSMSNERVLKEYACFMESLEENEYHYPVDFRRHMLTFEMHEWDKWMRSRDVVSSLLTGQEKTMYDNSTNNARRMKYIMLKNRYEGYGVISNDVAELLMPYTATDQELDGPSFDNKWKSRYGYSL